MRFFAFRTGRLAMRYARKHRHDGLGGIAIRCIRCAPIEYEQSPQAPRIPDDFSGPPQYPPPSDKAITLAEMQAQFMDQRSAPPPPAPPALPWEE